MPLILNGDGSVGPLSATEVGYLDGVTSAVQTQINSKLTTPGSWTSYSPTFVQATTSITYTGYAKYTQIGKTILLRVALSATSSGSAGGYIGITTPTGLEPSSGTGLNSYIGTIFCYTGGNYYTAAAIYTTNSSGTGIYGLGNATGNWFGATPSLTIASGNAFGVSVAYEVA